MLLFAPCDKEDTVMSSGEEAFLALSNEIPSSENKSFWQNITVWLTVSTGEKKRKWKMRKEA